MSSDNPCDQSSDSHEQWDDGPAKYGPNKDLTGYEEAVRRIEEAVQNGSRELYLNSLGLTRIPPEIIQLSGLTKLTLFDNKLESTKTLVEALTGLGSLMHLRLDRNKLKSNWALAQALKGLSSLIRLSLSNNQLRSNEAFTEALMRLDLLEDLKLDNNQITSNEALAVALKGLNSLHTLRLDNNQLRSNEALAVALKGLDSLDQLWLDNNQLIPNEALAVALKGLDSLGELWLDNNQLISNEALAVALKGLNSLHTLSLNNNQLTSDEPLAKALGGLGYLTSLDLSKNKLTSNGWLVKVLEGLGSLSKMSLGSNQLTSDESLLKALGGLSNMSQLSLQENRLTSTNSLADALGKLNSLEWLSIGGNDLGVQFEVFESFGKPARIIRAIQEIADGISTTHVEFKVVVLGEGRIGKTLLRHRLMNQSVRKNEPPTQSFEWEKMPKKVQKTGKAGKKQFGTLHLFDFGGQRKLMSSHRFFLGHRRTIYVICISSEESVEQSRLAHWLKFVDDVHEQAAHALANQRKADEEKINHRIKHSFEELLETARQELSRPPVIVVATRSLSEVRKLNLKEAQSLCKAHNATLIKDYDSLNTNPKDGEEKEALNQRVQSVRDAINDAACQDSMNDVWTEQYSKEGLDRREKIKEAFGFGQTGLVPDPDSKYWSIEDYLEFVTEKSVEDQSSEEFIDAMDQLQTLRELGFVHWLGDPNQIAFCDDSKSIQYSTRQHDCLIFSPAWVRGPIYRVLWQEDALGKAIYVNHAISGPDLNAYVQNKGQRVSPLYPELDNKETIDVIDLMDRSGLIFKYPDTGVQKYLVPDRLDDSDEKWAGWKDGEARFRMELDFAPDHLMPRLIGEINRSFTCERLTRHSVEITVGDGGYIRVYLDQSNAVLYAGVTIENNDVVAQTIRDVGGYVRTILNRNDVRFEQVVVKNEKKEQEGNEFDKAIDEILKKCLPSLQDIPEESYELNLASIRKWIELCDQDEKMPKANDPWKMSILIGLRCATDSTFIIYPGTQHESAVESTLKYWFSKLKSDLPDNALCEYAGDKLENNRIGSLTRAWGRARKLLGKDHAYFRIVDSPGSDDSHKSRGRHGFTEDDARGPFPED